MTIGQGPTSSRRRLRMTLRTLRESKGYSLEDVRKAMEWSLSKIIRIESGAVSVSVNDLKILLDFYEVAEPHTVDGLLNLARLSRQRHWSNAYRDYVSQAYLDFLGYEDDARIIKQFHPVIIPGLLQTESYARALITALGQPSEEEVNARVRMRITRQQHVFNRKNMADLRVIIDEPTLRRSIGGRAVMREQLDHLIKLWKHPRVDLIVIPQSVEAHPGIIGAFSLLEFDSDDDPDVVYLENAPNDVALVENGGNIDTYKTAFEKMLNVGIRGAEVLPRLERRREDLAYPL